MSDSTAQTYEDDASRKAKEKITSSAAAYNNLNTTQGGFYTSDQSRENEELRQRVAELEQQASAMQNPTSTVDDQLALMEKSYQLAAKYMPGGVQQQAEQTVTATAGDKAQVTPVRNVHKSVVSALQQEQSNEDFVAEYSVERNMAFNTAVGIVSEITYDRMILPHGLEVTFDKTCHVIFPAAIAYVDLGSANIIAGKADGAENVIRVKAAKRGFKGETNMSVITEDGAYYSFNVKYAREPRILNVEMADFIHDGDAVNRPNRSAEGRLQGKNSMNIYLKELGSESPVLVRLVMKSIWKENKRRVKHIGSKSFGIQFLLKGIYTHNGLLYFHTEIKNTSNVPFYEDYIIWKIVD